MKMKTMYDVYSLSIQIDRFDQHHRPLLWLQRQPYAISYSDSRCSLDSERDRVRNQKSSPQREKDMKKPVHHNNWSSGTSSLLRSATMILLLLIYLTAAVVLAETIDKQQQQQQQHQFPLPSKNTQKIQIDFNYYLSTIDNATSTSSISPETSTSAATTIDDDDEEEDDEEREKERLRKKYNVQRNPVADLKNFPEKRYVSCCVFVFITLPLP